MKKEDEDFMSRDVIILSGDWPKTLGPSSRPMGDKPNEIQSQAFSQNVFPFSGLAKVDKNFRDLVYLTVNISCHWINCR